MAVSSESTETAGVARAYFEAVGRRDLDAMEACFEAGATDEIHGLAALTVPGTFRSWFTNLFEAFPDFQFEILDVVATGEKAAVRWRARGSFTGSAKFEGIEANGASVDVQGCDVLTIHNGLIRRNDAYMNGAEMARQLGALPPLGSTAEKAAVALTNLKTRLRQLVASRG
ncbi:MAG TPA: nuclear transport factor 2 family protein [Solirubrobacterales bacterium]|nr:nuclear transport factor 2 family protein [Solirubrobacterales bacterium]